MDRLYPLIKTIESTVQGEKRPGWDSIIYLATSEIIATYVYKVGLTGTPQYSYSAAIGVFNSLVNVILVVTFNKISKKVNGSGLW